MDANDSVGPWQGDAPLPEHLDRLAGGMLSAARNAARELRRDPPDPGRRAWALGVLAGQTQAVLGPDMPDHPPVGDAAQEGFVRTALALALHVRAHSWAEKDLGGVGVPDRDDVPHPGERRAADAFDVVSRLMLPNASTEGWTATLVTDLARGDKTLEAAVKLGKYVLHPTFLALTDDVTRVLGEALHNINVQRLKELIGSLRRYAEAGPSLPVAGPERTPAACEPMPVLPPVAHRTTKPPERPAPKRRRSKRVPERISEIEPDPLEFESGLDTQLTWPPDSDESPNACIFNGEYERGLETDVSPELDDPENRGRDLRGPFGF